MEVLYSTGARLMEMVGILVADVQMRRGALRLHGKGGKERVVPLGKTAVRWLETYVRMRDDLLRDCADAATFWITSRGSPLSYHGAEKIVLRNCRAAGLHPFSSHALRRACATHMLAHGAPPAQLQMLLGHASMKDLNQYLAVGIRELKVTHDNSGPGQ